MEDTVFLITILFFVALLLGFLYWSALKFKKQAKKKEEEIKHQVYELSILKEISDRIGYSLNLENIVDIVTGSLPQFIDYSVAGYMILSPEKILFKAKLKKTVSRVFIDDVKKRMLGSLSALLDKELLEKSVEEVLTGVVLIKKKKEPVESFFNIPLIVSGNVMGVLTIAHTVPGLYKEKEMTLLYKIVAEALNSVSRLENVIKTEQGKLGAMVEGMEDGILMTDKNYRIIVANPAVKNIAGIGDKEDVTVFDFMDGFRGKFDLKGKLEESVALGKILDEEELIINDSAFQVFVSPVTSGKEVFGGVVVFHDVTRVKQAEKIKEDFISMMVHELRTPLDGIKKIGELMKSDNSIRENVETYGEYIGMVHESSSEMLELVNDLLDVSRIESGKFGVYREPSSIEEIVNERIKFFDAVAKDSKVDLTRLFVKGIPKVIELDPSKISQVLNNLLSNAIKFTRADGNVVVQVFTHKNGGDINKEASEAGIDWFPEAGKIDEIGNSLVVAVTDTGDGISSENIAKLFNKFVQFESSARSGKRGTGLGLVIARGIVEAHDGVLRVNSKEGEGSTFYFTINL